MTNFPTIVVPGRGLEPLCQSVIPAADFKSCRRTARMGGSLAHGARQALGLRAVWQISPTGLLPLPVAPVLEGI